jgi:hypothetical protein
MLFVEIADEPWRRNRSGLWWRDLTERALVGLARARHSPPEGDRLEPGRHAAH